MINSYMSKEEILRESWKNYKEVIKPRCFKVASRLRKDLLPVHKNSDTWNIIKNPITVKVGGNTYKALFWVKFPNKHDITIKTLVWFTYLDSKTGSKRTILLPSDKNIEVVIMFTPNFFKEWAEQTNLTADEVTTQSEFFKWTEGTYTIYNGTENPKRIGANFNNLGVGLGWLKDEGIYEFKHFLGEDKFKEMQKKVGNDIVDPIRLWDAYYKKPELTINPEECDPNFDYFELERKRALDDIFEKYG